MKTADNNYCSYCGIVFTSLEFLQSHVQRKHPKNIGEYKCGKCPYATNNKAHLRKHRYMHTKKAHLECRFCGKMYGRPESLLLHIRSKHTGNPFPCSVCGRTFATGARLNWHMLGHDRVKRLLCEICGLTFVRLNNLTRHEEDVHQIHYTHLMGATSTGRPAQDGRARNEVHSSDDSSSSSNDDTDLGELNEEDIDDQLLWLVFLIYWQHRLRQDEGIRHWWSVKWWKRWSVCVLMIVE